MAKKIQFSMDANVAMKARDFLALALSKRTPEEWASRKTSARRLLADLETAIRLEVGPRGDRDVTLRPGSSQKAVKKTSKKTAAKKRS